jgi:sec-independent protein translocase protein TatB
MFNIGGGEFVVIALIALIVLGPQRLPEAARQVGKAMGDLRRLSSGFQHELKGALEDAERTATTAPPRDVLGAGSSAPAEPQDSSSSAAPEPRTERARTPRPPRTTPLKAAPVPKASRPRSKGA